MDQIREKFQDIYLSHEWGSTSKSGPGSEPHRLNKYREILTGVLRDHPIKSVVDVGCGDWALASSIDWTGIDYTGIDIVPELIDDLTKRFGKPGVAFRCANLVDDELPSADLCVVKDVLQHLSNEHISTFLSKLSRFRFALLTNDYSTYRRIGWGPFGVRLRTFRKRNADTKSGGWQMLDLRDPPFNLRSRKIADFEIDVPEHRVGFRKQSLLWERIG